MIMSSLKKLNALKPLKTFYFDSDRNRYMGISFKAFMTVLKEQEIMNLRVE